MGYLGNQPQSGAIRSEFFTGNNSTTTYNLAYEYGNEASVLVFIDGVKQKTDSYAVINGQIIFTTAPPTSGTNNIEVVYLGGSVVTTPYLSADEFGIIRINAAELTQNATITTGYNASSAGPLKVANNITVSVANNSTWTIF
jgi:hypothetical protein